MTMKYTEEIFNILSKGGFISSNSVSTQVKRLYDAIEEDLPDYYDYYKGIVFIWKAVTVITTLPARNRKSIWNVNWKQFRSGLIT